jgi:hypothetical protein
MPISSTLTLFWTLLLILPRWTFTASHRAEDAIIDAIRTRKAWELPPPVGIEPAVAMWDPEGHGSWAAQVEHFSDCPVRIPGNHDRPSIRTKVRPVFQDNGNCLAMGNVDSGTCLTRIATNRTYGKHIPHNLAETALCFPSLLIIGTGKAGTAELQSWLSRHPAMRRIGNPNSTSGGGEGDYFGRDVSSQDDLERTWRRYLSLWAPTSFSDLPNQYHFEKSPGYLAHSADPNIIKRLLPSVKLVRKPNFHQNENLEQAVTRAVCICA